MTVKDMLEKITEVEKRRKVSVYITYDAVLGWKFKMYGRAGNSDVGVVRTIQANQIAIWDIVILENFLESMADAVEIGVSD